MLILVGLLAVLDAAETLSLLRSLADDELAEEEWSHLDCLVGHWAERHRRRTELVTFDAGETRKE